MEITGIPYAREMMDQKERRLHTRKTLVAEGRIRGPKGKAIACRLQNISETGAMIALETEADLPRRFVFEIEGNVPIARICALAWRDGVYAGMEFICRRKKRGARFVAV